MHSKHITTGARLRKVFTVTLTTVVLAFSPFASANDDAGDDIIAPGTPVRIPQDLGIVRPTSMFGGTCNCYYNTDCASTSYCDLFVCTEVGKLDGICKVGKEPTGPGGGFEPIDLPLAAESGGLLFTAFELTARNPKGIPTREAYHLIDKAQQSRLSIEGHLAVQAIVNNVLDRIIGFDIVYEPKQSCGVSGLFPNYRGEYSEALGELLRVVRNSVTTAISNNDPSVVAWPIRRFWRMHPDFRPNHSGRCYPHGHDDYPYESPAECQVKEILAILRANLPRDAY